MCGVFGWIAGAQAAGYSVGQGVPNCELFGGSFESRQTDHISKMSKLYKPDAAGPSLAQAPQRAERAERDPSVWFSGSAGDLLVEGVLVPYV